ncbi:AzlD domain-containing protein [Actinophytocola xanthii]|uniref:Branched-chain amino acid ABC transporter n=1 Tax=Actinophytocola xanthii TaxID=1912961 RepID=A0A1Q8CKD0_9PSEU|nr:AzlD domain-containing protein [Actinophytocola xanthii]OLF14806.1 branched-chain amino acid ABC transporter [Actinophytocola xanthii]
MTIWLAIGCVALLSFAMKAVGPAVLGDRELSGRARGVVALLAPVLLAGLVVVNVAGPGWRGLDWTLVVGLGGVVAARACRAPVLVAVLAGVVVTAVLRVALG